MMLLVTALLVVFVTSTYGQHELTILENGKLCSQWITISSGQVSLSYIPNSACTSQVGIEQKSNQVRLCCNTQTLPSTTSSPDFPRECGKQKYQPSRDRIVGGVQARPNSWVVETRKC